MLPPPGDGLWAEPPPSVTLGWGPGALPRASRVVGAPPGHGGCCHGAAWGCPPPQHPVLAPVRQGRAGEAGRYRRSSPAPLLGTKPAPGGPPLSIPAHARCPASACLETSPHFGGHQTRRGPRLGTPPGRPSSNQAVLAACSLCSYPDGCVRQLGGRGQSLPGGGVRVLPPPKLCKGAGVQSAPALG